jgi:hypothetical protein
VTRRAAFLGLLLLLPAWACAAHAPAAPKPPVAQCVAQPPGEAVSPPVEAAAPEAEAPARERIALMPLESPREVAPDALHCPICGIGLVVGDIEPGAEERLTGLIQAWLVANRCFDVLDPGVAEGVYQRLLKESMTGTTKGYMRGVGRELGAEAVLGGIVYRYRERVGTAYSISQAASIGFDLHLVRTADGAVIWSGHFDETQKTLTENVFNIFRFFRRGVRWLSVDQFAAQAVSEAFAEFPRQTQDAAE